MKFQKMFAVLMIFVFMFSPVLPVVNSASAQEVSPAPDNSSVPSDDENGDEEGEETGKKDKKDNEEEGGGNDEPAPQIQLQSQNQNNSNNDNNGNNEPKVTLCHYDQEEDAYKTLSVGASAVQAHLDHGDTLGECEEQEPEEDETAPAKPVHLSKPDGSTWTTATLDKLDWTTVTDDSEPVTYRYESSNSAATGGDGSFTSPVYESGVLSASEIPTGGTPEGTYYWHVMAVDAAGNESGWTSAWTVIVDNTPDEPTPDTTAPVVSIGLGNGNDPENTGPTHNSTVSGTVSVYATVQDANLAGYHFRIVGPGGSQGHACGAALADAENQGYNECGYIYNLVNLDGTSFTNQIIAGIDTTQLPNGEYQFILGAGDEAGNRTTADYNNDPKVFVNVNNQPLPPQTVTVAIAKYVDGEMATAESTNSASFPMTSSWVTTNIGSGTGNYPLDASGFNSTSTPYVAVTSQMNVGSNYTTYENIDGFCAESEDYKLVGYSTGNSFEEAEEAQVTTTVPSFENLQQSKYIIVWNAECEDENEEPEEPEVPMCNLISGSFDNFATGTVNGQDGWMATGPYDQAVVTNTYGYDTFGCQTLRVSDAITSGSFGDWIFAKPIANAVGEFTVNDHFEVEFDIASADSEYQSGLHVSVSPDRGDGSRMSFLRFNDTEGGIDVTFADVSGSATGTVSFNSVVIASGLDREVPHTIKLTLDIVAGHSNDVVKVYIDGELVHTGTSWENYYRFDPEAAAEQAPRDVDTIIIQARGNGSTDNNPNALGKGFLFDNISMSSSDLVQPEEPEEPENETPTITTNDDDDDNNNGRSGSRRRGGGGSSNENTGQVLGVAFTDTPEPFCPEAITTYIKAGLANDVESVKKLQAFLNKEMGTNLEVTGVYDTATIAAVNAFQLKYTDKVLTPWGINAPTGYVFKLTRWWVNTIICGTQATSVAPQI